MFVHKIFSDCKKTSCIDYLKTTAAYNGQSFFFMLTIENKHEKLTAFKIRNKTTNVLNVNCNKTYVLQSK